MRVLVELDSDNNVVTIVRTSDVVGDAPEPFVDLTEDQAQVVELGMPMSELAAL